MVQKKQPEKVSGSIISEENQSSIVNPLETQVRSESGNYSGQDIRLSNAAVLALSQSSKLAPRVITSPVTQYHTLQKFQLSSNYLRYTNIAYLQHYHLFNQNTATIQPINLLDSPIRTGNYFIQPDREKKQLHFLLEEPTLVDFSLSIEKEASETAVASGGRATISLSLYRSTSIEELEAIRTNNKDLFKGYRNWKFLPINLKNIQATLSLSETEITGDVEVNVSNTTGSTVFIVNLSNTGTTNWYNLIKTGRVDSIQGLCNFSINYYVKSQNKVQIKQVNYNILLNQLLSSVTLGDVNVINPMQTLDTQIIVQGSPLIKNVSIDFKPSKGQSAKNFVFGKEGGKANVKITDLDLKDLTINLSHKVDFEMPGWPIIREQKVLTYQNNNWSEVIDPASWITKYTLMVFLLDENDNVITEQSNLGLNRVICELAYTADYLEGEGAIISVLETHSEKIEEIHFPLPEGEAPGELKLSITALRSKNGQMLEPRITTRGLSPSATFIIVKVRPDGSIEVVSNEDAITERSLEDEMISKLEQLYQGENTTGQADSKAISENTMRVEGESTTPYFKKLLRYLKTNEEDFAKVEPYYFPELEKYLIYQDILSDCDIIDRNNFHNAIAEFQSRNGLTNDGIPGESTLWALQKPYVMDHPMEIHTVTADRVPGYEEGYDQFRLRADAAFYYEGLREEILSLGGVITSSGSLRSLSARVTPGRSSKSMHYTGIALDLYINSGMRNPAIDPYIITKEGRKWTVYCRVPYGGETINLNAIVWKGGHTTTKPVVARVVNFTDIAAKYGFKNISSRSCFPGNYLCSEWWHFQNEYLLTPYINQFGIEVMRLATTDYDRLKRSPLWINRKKIFQRSWY